MKLAMVKSIVSARRFFEEFPNGLIPTGIWYHPTYSKEEFYHWFHTCLNEKTGGGPYTDREIAKINDARLINDYQRGGRHSGSRNLLSKTKNKEKYPHIDNQPFGEW
jgi:hypothetical protein